MDLNWKKWMRCINARVCFVVWVYCTLVYQIGHRLRYSVFYYADLPARQELETRRKVWAEDYLMKMASRELVARLGDTRTTARSDHRFCIVTGSAYRVRSYLFESAASTVRGVITSDARDEVSFVINDVSKNEEPRLDIHRLKQLGLRVISRPGKDRGMDHFRQQSSDVAETLRFCLEETNAPYFVYLEDDSFLVTRFVDHALDAIDDAEKSKVCTTMPGDCPWFFLRLFRTAHYDGFSRTQQHIVELIGFGGVVSFLFLCLFPPLSKTYHGSTTYLAPILTRTRTQTENNFNVCHILFRLVWVWVFVSCGIFILGRQHTTGQLIDMQHGVKIDKDDPGAVGILFQRKYIPDFIKYLEFEGGPRYSNHRTEVDVAMNRYRDEFGLISFVVRPNLVQHLGRKTATKSKTQFVNSRSEQGILQSYFKESEWFEEVPTNPITRWLHQFGCILLIMLTLTALHFILYNTFFVGHQTQATRRTSY